MRHSRSYRTRALSLILHPAEDEWKEFKKFFGKLKGKDWTSDLFLKDPKRAVRPDDQLFSFPLTKVDEPLSAFEKVPSIID